MQDDGDMALNAALAERIVVLDGAMGSLIQQHGLEEADFRGERFKAHPSPLKNCNDLLVVTQPALIESIHREYLEAGADVVETNSFNANAISMADYDLQDACYELNVEAARVARRATDAWLAEHGERRFVAGSMGPTTRTASIGNDTNDPGARGVTFDQLRAAYYDQARGLVDGGADLLLAETVFDTLNLKAALFAIAQLKEERGLSLPVMASVTFTQEGSERTLSGQTIEAFWSSIAHCDLAAVLINCGLGAAEMRSHVQALSNLAPIRFGCYPNAGLPNELGEFDETPERMAELIGAFAREGWLNLAGGCCGTTPAHIKAIAEAVRGASPRRVRPRAERSPLSDYSGLEHYAIREDSNFTLIGERTNVSGSRQFLRLIKQGKFDKAVEVARQQVEGGANIIDVCVDDGLIDGPATMTQFINLLASEPDIARLPVMIDSSDWEVIEAGVKCLQGKGVVNSLSLKDGEEEFLRRARIVRRYGASVLVMGFDEEKQAVTVEDRVAVATRAYRLLTEEVGFPPEDVIYDANIFPVATGLPEHRTSGVNFIEAVREIKATLPGIKTSGGLSNISFSFRGNEPVREAMHAVFLYHAIAAGLDMAIVNAGQLEVYDAIDPELRERVEDVILDRRADATERLLEFAAGFRGEGKKREEDLSWREGDLAARFAHALLHGVVRFVEEDVAEALSTYAKPLEIIEGPLMDGMTVVGDLFGAGKMFLPQVVKSARVMQKAVALIEPHMAGAGATSRGKVVLATVKGDVHDIGKNIVGVVLGCNGFDVIDLGVMVPAERILEAAKREGADLIGLSGLITPSLLEMVHVGKEMDRQGFVCPLLIGGATTSRKHTAIKIAPAYSGPVLYVPDASQAAKVVADLLDSDRRGVLETANRAAQATAREAFAKQPSRRPLLSLADAQARRATPAFNADTVTHTSGLRGSLRAVEGDLPELVELIDWTPFFTTWQLRGTYPAILDKPHVGQRARELKADADAMLARAIGEGWLTAKAVYGLFPAHQDGDDIVLASPRGGPVRLPMLRQQAESSRGRPQLCLADFVAPQGEVEDAVGAFVLTTGLGCAEAVARFRADLDDYNAILLQALADRLAEAFAEWLHREVRCEWGLEEPAAFTAEELIKERYRGIRPAPGYPACPDHQLKRQLFSLLDAEAATGVSLTESLAMSPAASVCGLYFGHADVKYFAVGKIGRDQVEDYAARLGATVEETERWLASSLGYEPSA